MRLYIKTYDLSRVSLPQHLRKWCYSRSLKYEDRRSETLIVPTLKDMISEKYGCVYIAHDGSRLLGWAIVNEVPFFGREFQCYVLPSQRRKGIATKLLAKATDMFGAVKVYSHSLSNKFFEHHGLTPKSRITGKKLKRKCA